MPAAPARLHAAAAAVRRRVLARRRLIAALLVGMAVLAGLRATAGPPPATVQVRVAARDLPAGTVLGRDDLATAAFSPGTVPDGVVETPAGRTLAAAVTRGEPITRPRLVGPELAAADPDRRAVPVRFPDSAQVAMLRPGDLIEVWAADPQGVTAPERLTEAVVLAVPDPDREDAGDSLPGRLTVLGVPHDAVRDVTQHSVTSFLTYSFSG